MARRSLASPSPMGARSRTMDANLKRAFAQYVSAYNAEDPKIKLKIDHSYRVADLAERIASSVTGADPEFAWRIGLLHDIGRFEQVRRYNTFIDAISVDHGQFGADQLLHEGVLEQLGGTYSDEQRRQLELAIRWHSAYRIPEGLTEQERMYCDILRDVDKIDIFIVNEIEGAGLAGIDSDESDTIIKALQKRFPDKKIVLTLGENGSCFIHGEQIVRQGIYKVDVVDTTAAGDTFTGFFLAGVCKGLDAQECLRVASLAAAGKSCPKTRIRK